MKKFFTMASAFLLSILMAASSFDPASAGPIQKLNQPQLQNSNVVDVQYRQGSNRRPETRRHPSNRRPSSGPRRGNSWHGYRGSRYRRPGYRRRNDGWWYPAAAFTAGALIGTAAASRPVYRPSGPSNRDRHVSWCMNRFRSYRVSDNTFQPYSGARRQCVSPYSVH